MVWRGTALVRRLTINSGITLTTFHQNLCSMHGRTWLRKHSSACTLCLQPTKPFRLAACCLFCGDVMVDLQVVCRRGIMSPTWLLALPQEANFLDSSDQLTGCMGGRQTDDAVFLWEITRKLHNARNWNLACKWSLVRGWCPCIFSSEKNQYKIHF